MFGYVLINPEALDEPSRERYQAHYCGLCRTLKERHGNISRATLSYDMTFLLILLSSLYEPEEEAGTGRCIAHPLRQTAYTRNAIAAYVADMNVALAYHKSLDDWQDDRSHTGLAGSKLLHRAYRRVETAYPDKCARIAQCLADISRIEQANKLEPDLPANLTAEMLSEIFVYQDDLWQTPLRTMGASLGRFIYLMDAYDDLPDDIAKHRYNPLVSWQAQDGFEDLCREGLMMMMSECVRAFEVLPLKNDVDILRNILYGGVWRRYVAIQKKRGKEAPVA